ncbi:MAG: phage tail protein [Tannerella sp.]|jgi:phage tail-like protein|nr:phage tail protein [Tannerella sp.]
MWDLPVAFYFRVTIDGEEFPFKEVSGLSVEMETENIKEGGVNDFEYKLPKQIKHGNLVLKRALAPVSSGNVQWIKQWIENDFSTLPKTKNIVVSLIDADQKPKASWTCTDAYPVKWEAENFDAEKNVLAVEAIEFVYKRLIREQ